MFDVKYYKNYNDYIYTCPKCGHEHEITDEYYEFGFVHAHIEHLNTCDNCKTSLFLSYQEGKNEF